jgi:glutathione peroxidase-family protein
MKPIYDVSLNSADGNENFLNQYKGKVTMVVNTTVGCGNANQLEVLQWLQEKYQDQGFEIIAIPTNDYCGPGVTKGKWSRGITCGLDSQEYGKEVYNVTFKYSEMVASIPNSFANEYSEHKGNPKVNGLGIEHSEPHEIYKEISDQLKSVGSLMTSIKGEFDSVEFLSPWLNQGFYNGTEMSGNFEKYLIDRDGYVVKHFTCTALNYDTEKTLKESLLAEFGHPGKMGEGRTPEVFAEEFAFISNEIEKLLSGDISPLNPNARVLSKI